MVVAVSASVTSRSRTSLTMVVGIPGGTSPFTVVAGS